MATGKWEEIFRRRKQAQLGLKQSDQGIGLTPSATPGTDSCVLTPRDAPHAGATTAHSQPSAHSSPSSAGSLDPASPAIRCALTGQTHVPTLNRMRFALEGIWSTMLLHTTASPHSLLICGASKGEGATFLSFHLALFLCREYCLKVLYIDTAIDDTRSKPIYETRNLPGLAAYYFENKPLDSLIIPTDHERLDILPSGAGTSRGNTGTILFKREPLIDLLEFGKLHYDLLIFDGQPIIMTPSTLGYARAVDQVILVCRYAQSRREVTQIAVDKLNECEATIAGVILNDRLFPIPPIVYKFLR